eukprot:3050860-Prymnesium_polylepis.5
MPMRPASSTAWTAQTIVWAQKILSWCGHHRSVCHAATVFPRPITTCVRTTGQPRCHLEVATRAAVSCHLITSIRSVGESELPVSGGVSNGCLGMCTWWNESLIAEKVWTSAGVGACGLSRSMAGRLCGGSPFCARSESVRN